VPELVDRACSVIQKGFEHAAVGAAWIHAAVAAIHPFTDGNGRVARVVASLAMYRGGFNLPEFTSVEEWWGRHLAEYYASFRCLGSVFDADADVTPLIRAHLRAQLHQVRALDLRERVQQRIWTVVEEAVSAAGLDSRVANAVWDAFFGRSVTPRYYRPSPTSVSRPRRKISPRPLPRASFARLAGPGLAAITRARVSTRESQPRSACRCPSPASRREGSSSGNSPNASLQSEPGSSLDLPRPARAALVQ
jgi:hypothetical protein